MGISHFTPLAVEVTPVGPVAGSLCTTGRVEVLVEITGAVGSGGKVRVKSAGWGKMMLSAIPGKDVVDVSAHRPGRNRERGRGDAGRNEEVVRPRQKAVCRGAALGGGNCLATGQGEGEGAWGHGGKAIDEVRSGEVAGRGIGVFAVGAHDGEIGVVRIARPHGWIARLELGEGGRRLTPDDAPSPLNPWPGSTGTGTL